MKVLVIVGLVLAATLQADARAIVVQDLPKVLRDTMEQTFSCALSLGPAAANLPKLHGMQQLPEDNPALNQLWGCIWEKKGIINKQGDINADHLSNYLIDLLSIFSNPVINVEKIANEVTGSCKDIKGSDYRIISIKLQNCIENKLLDYQ